MLQTHSVYFEKAIAQLSYVSIGILSEDVSSIKLVLVLFGQRNCK